jgi:SAM-dependent methyltransferase
MALHPLAASFAAVADVYERGRPGYPPAAVDALSAELALAGGARVLDLAAGTGKLTRALLAAGLDVVAVEPQGPLRDTLVAHVGAERVLDGLAEAIPLPDESVDAVTVADAFHWFDKQAALAEIHRVLRPGGGLAVLFTLPDWSGVSWAAELGELLVGLRPDHPGFDGPSWQDAVRVGDRWTAPREVQVVVSQPAGPERIVAYVASVSWIAALPAREREATLAQAEQIVNAGETPGELPLRIVLGLTSRR